MSHSKSEADSSGRLRLLTFSTLYPNPQQPNHGVFVENRLRHLVGSGAAASTVVAPVAYVPAWLPPAWGPAHLARVPAREDRHGLAVHHPRYPVLPRVGMSVAPGLLYVAALRAVRRLLADGLAVDAIDAHYVYPDGVAAVRLGQTLGLPVVVTARGSDVTQLPDFPLPRRMIGWAVSHAAALIAVSTALGERLVELGADPAKVTVLRNGVDLMQFRPPGARTAAAGPRLLSVGHLIARKGHDRVIGALAALPGATLLIAGAGPERAALEALADRLGVAPRVRFLGAVAHAELAAVYGAADVLVLASAREGWANVLLEAAACGTPVVASPIPGNAEVVAGGIGVVAAANTPQALADAVSHLLAAPPSRAAIRAAAERFGWDEVSAGQHAVFARVLGRPARLVPQLGPQPGSRPGPLPVPQRAT